MKKQYSSPIAEKMVFDYEQNIVASATEEPDIPVQTNVAWSGNPWVGNKGDKSGCTKIDKC